MFGQNPIRPLEQHLSGSTLRVQEVFYTLQGEGPFSGVPCTFIRLAGCNLRCHFCFVATTSVRMADGTSKPISEIRVGDLVISYASGEWVPKEVTKVMKSESEALVRVTHGAAKTFATPDHPFYVRDRGWVPAAELEPGDQLVHLSQSAQKRLWNPMRDPESVKKAHAGRDYANNKLSKLWNDPESRARLTQRMRDHNPMKGPAVTIKGFLNRADHKVTSAELSFMKMCDGLPIEYCGDGTLVIGNKIPDFIVSGEKKVIEVWAADSLHGKERKARWKAKRRAHFAAHGYETLFVAVPPSGVRNGDFSAIRERVAEFCFNGDEVREVRVVDRGGKAWVRLAGTADAPTVAVYNLEVSDTHNYVANGVVVHNCDTQFDTGWDNALSSPHIIKAMDFEGGFVARKHELVVLTGGEPLIQNIVPLLQGLFTAGVHHVQIETAGTTWVDGMRDYVEAGKVTIVCSPKTPKVHPMIAKYCRNWKYVVKAGETSLTDGLPNFSTQRQAVEQPLFRPFNACDRVGTIWISPCDEHDHHKNVANMVAARDICLEHGYRLSLQTHKIVNVR